MEPPLGAQLPTPVALAMHCLVHSHALVELIKVGVSLHPSVNVRIKIFSILSLVCVCVCLCICASLHEFGCMYVNIMPFVSQGLLFNFV